MNALDVALALLAKATTALERHNQPSTTDVEEAMNHSKDAHRILKNAHELLGEGIYEVTDEPDAGTPLPFEQDDLGHIMRKAQKNLKEGEFTSLSVDGRPPVKVARGKRGA